MTGPVTFAMSVDVTDLSLEDTYAIYAGWHAMDMMRSYIGTGKIGMISRENN